MLGTSIKPGQSESRILVFKVPMQGQQFTLSLRKDDKSVEDVAAPVGLTTQVAQAPRAPTPTPVAPTPTPTTKPARDDVAVVDDIKRYLYEGFGMPGYQTSWYPLIKGVGINGDTVVVETDLYPDEEGKRAAAPLCSAVSGYVYATKGRDLGLKQVWVFGQGKRILIARKSIAELCK